MRFDQFIGTALGKDSATTDDRDTIAELCRLLHVVGREDQRFPLRLQTPEAVPDQVSGTQVQARGRLVKDNQIRIIHQRPGNQQTPLHSSRQISHTGVGATGKLHKGEQFIHPQLGRATSETVVGPE